MMIEQFERQSGRRMCTVPSSQKLPKFNHPFPPNWI